MALFCQQINKKMPSSVVASMQYDPSSKELKIVFVSGMVYVYQQVPETEYIAMKTSGSKGTYLNTHIKGKYAFVKLK
jgi:hypothetical protein